MLAADLEDNLSVERCAVADWTIVFFYIGAAGLAAGAAFVAYDGKNRVGWAVLVVLLVILALNDWLQLLGRLTQLVRDHAKAGGWYDGRETFQTEFALVVVAATLLAGGLIGHCLRGAGIWLKLAAIAALVVICALALNATSIHEVDKFMRLSLLGRGPGWWLELLNASLIGLCAIASIRGRGAFRPQAAHEPQT